VTRPVGLALGAVAGALLVGPIEETPALAVAAIALLVALAFGATRVRQETLVRHRYALSAACVGAALVLLRSTIGTALAPAATSSTPLAAGWSEQEAVVLSVGTPAGGTQRATVELTAPGAERVYAWLPRYPSVVVGDVIRFAGPLEPAPTDAGFGEFLARAGIAWTTRARTLERLGGDGTPVAALEAVRREAAALLTRAMPEPQAGLGAAMMIGLRDLVARDVAADFRTSGLSHVVAISGWHICLLAAVVTAALGRLTRRPRTLIVLVVVASYSILAGASPSILRAAVMASVALLARESGRSGQASAALGLTCFGLILFEPATVEDVGFQLSAAATAGLLAWSSRLRSWLEARLATRSPGWLLEALSVSLAAQAATLPLILFHFGSLSAVAPLANLLVAPLVAPAMLLTVVAFVAGGVIAAGVPALLLAPITLLSAIGVGAMIGVAQVTARLPFAAVQIAEPLNVVVAVGSLLLIAFVARRRSRSDPTTSVVAGLAKRPRITIRLPIRLNPRRLTLGGGTASLCLVLVLVQAARPDGRLHVTVLDVGQGDAILLEGPTGGRALIDTGPDPDRLLALLDQRLPAWDRRVDLVVLTHPHEDHVAGLALLLDRYRIGAIVEPGMVGPGPGDAAYRRRLTELGRETRVVAAGDRLWLDGIALDVEWPLPGRVALRAPDGGRAINNVSIVLDLRFGERRMLFSGDVEEDIDPHLLAAGIADKHGGRGVDLLKVAHHGSRTATTDAFVERLDPQVAVISAGSGNPYGHPSRETVARLTEAGARLFRTDIDGSVEISTDGSDLVASATGGQPVPTRRPAESPGVGFCPIPALSSEARQRLTYNRRDDDPFPDPGRGDHARRRSERKAADPLLGRRRDCRVPLCCHGPPRC
jgi:competence protein ComEC